MFDIPLHKNIIDTFQKEIKSMANEKSTLKKAEIPHNYWLMTEKLKNNDFYEILKEVRNPLDWNQQYIFKYNGVLGIDFGHGETTAYFLSWNSEKIKKKFFKKAGPTIEADVKIDFESRRVPITEKNEKIHTMIAFNKGATIIGEDAKGYPDFYQHFKKHPDETKDENWSDKAPGGKYSYKELMSKFFKEVFRSILENDKNIKDIYEKGKLMVCIGCPASNEWLNPDSQNKFKNLVSEAIADPENKIPTPYITIVPESTAALMAGMFNGKTTDNESEGKTNKINICKGIAVFDIGSSTIDFTYILPGKIIITKSKLWGGYNIDQLFLNAALNSKGLEQNQVSNNIDKLRIAVREIKETYYDHGDKEIYNDEIIIEVKENKKLEKIEINKAFIENEVWGINKGVDHEGQKLLKKFSDFILECFHAVEYKECGSVFISGGTGKVTEVSDIIKEIFGIEPLPHPDRSYCVAEGLCLMKKIEILVQSFLQEYHGRAYGQATACYDKILRYAVDNMVPLIIEKLFPAIEDAINSGKPIKDNDFKTLIKEKIENDSSDCMKVFSDAIGKILNEYRNNFYAYANQISATIYDNDFKFEMNLSDNVVIQSNGAENPYNIAISQMLADLLYSKRFIELISSIYSLMPFAKTTDPKAAKKIIQDGLLKFREEHKWDEIQSKKLYSFLSKAEKKGFEKEANKNLYTSFKNEYVLKEEITDYLMLNAEAILGKVMFYVYDNKPEILDENR